MGDIMAGHDGPAIVQMPREVAVAVVDDMVDLALSSPRQRRVDQHPVDVGRDDVVPTRQPGDRWRVLGHLAARERSATPSRSA
jgi:hypothetical protein